MDDLADVPGLRLAELVAAISQATDLGTGQPMEHALQTCLLSVAVAVPTSWTSTRRLVQTCKYVALEAVARIGVS